MATIRKRNQRWQVQVRKNGVSSISKRFFNKKDAVTWANTIESEIDRGVYIDRSLAEVTLLSDVFDRFAKEIIPGLKGAKSEHSRMKHLIKNLGHISLAQIRPQALAEYRDKRLTLVGPQSVKHELGLLNRVLKIAHREWGYILPETVQNSVSM